MKPFVIRFLRAWTLLTKSGVILVCVEIARVVNLVYINNDSATDLKYVCKFHIAFVIDMCNILSSIKYKCFYVVLSRLYIYIHNLEVSTRCTVDGPCVPKNSHLVRAILHSSV